MLLPMIALKTHQVLSTVASKESLNILVSKQAVLTESTNWGNAPFNEGSILDHPDIAVCSRPKGHRNHDDVPHLKCINSTSADVVIIKAQKAILCHKSEFEFHLRSEPSWNQNPQYSPNPSQENCIDGGLVLLLGGLLQRIVQVLSQQPFSVEFPL